MKVFGFAMKMVIAGEIDFGGGDLCEQGEGGVDVGLIDVRNAAGLEPKSNETGEEGRVQCFESSGDLESTVRGKGGVGLDPVIRLEGQVIVVTSGVRGESDKGGCDIAIESLIEAGEDVVAEAVAAMGGGGVGRVLAEAEFVIGDAGVDISAAPGEEGAVEDEAVVERLNGFHAGDAGEAGAATGVG